MENKTWGPAWFYGPNGAAEIFTRESDVPAGWQDHPSKIGKTGKTDLIPAPAPTPSAAQNVEEIDAHGHAWNENLHAATRSKTKEGLWRMKVGVTRPAPLPGYPVPLDL